MKINPQTLSELSEALSAERKRQGLSREDAAAVCGVSTSFIRDAESAPENCTLGKLVKLINGLGLSLEIPSLQATQVLLPKSKANFSVPDSQLVPHKPQERT
jgi:transcriptional regulator with XRE-family HTH domain